MIQRLLLFLLINFAALGIGGLFTGDGVSSEWYANLNKAPWTPPGWVFGFAWTTIMLCYAVYMALLWPSTDDKVFLVSLFSAQFLLNVLWNPVFFYFQQVSFGLAIIILLTVLMVFFLFYFWSNLKYASLLVLPYVLWLMIASSLNLYIYMYN